MTDPKHLAEWTELKDSVLQACNVRIEAYAIVAIGIDGECYWGARYSEVNASEMAMKLRVLAQNAKEFAR